MSKEESTILKGVAILLMLFLHLFNGNKAELCQPLLYIGEMPLVSILVRAANPVAFFVILSGYGLGYVYSHGKLNLKSQGKRLLKLYIHYWIILLMFVPVGCYIHPDKYPGDIWKIIGNITSWNSSYNYETWFLFPYAMISLTAYPIFTIIRKLGNTRSLLLFFLITLTSNYVTSRYIAVYKLYDSFLAHVLTYLGFLFCFTVGAVMQRVSESLDIRIKKLERYPLLAATLLLLIVVFRCFFTTGVFHDIYVVFFMILFIHIPQHRYIKLFLIKMGKHSMPIWMIHSFFCYYLFKEFIYGFRYPSLIFAGLLCISYVVSIPIMKISSCIIKWLKL